MRTMFVSQENNSIKKRFQKPNILRKKPSQRGVTNERPAKITAPKLQLKKPSHVTVNEQFTHYLAAPMKKLTSDNDALIESGNVIDLTHNDINVQFEHIEEGNVLSSDNNESSVETINLESFLNNSEVEKIVTQADIEREINEMRKQEWCIDFINNAQEIIIEDIDGSHLGSLRLATNPNLVEAVPLSAVIQDQSSETVTSTVPTKNLTLEYLPNSTMNFQCDSPKCTKWFRSQQTLDRHKATHKSKANKPVVIACPVKKMLPDGTEEPCQVYCQGKDAMVKHLNEDHSPDDAMYICTECSRRFYWAAGLRAHSRTHSAAGAGAGSRAPLACPWEGCGRAFRQPCRLREHMRAHTGDKPYPCRYPECGWSFRTASKLMRHARRHTGERRHACGSCARAFRRPEHLRHHLTRQPCLRYQCQCTHAGCEKKFNNVEALKIHREKIHKEVIDELLPSSELVTLEFASSDAEDPPEPMSTTSYIPPAIKSADINTEGIFYVNLHTSDHNMDLPGSSEACTSLPSHDLPNESIELVTAVQISEIHGSQDTESDILEAGDMKSIVGKTELESGEGGFLIHETGQIEDFDVRETGVEGFGVGNAGEADTFVGKAVSEEEGVTEGAEDGVRCARTHCAWPFYTAQSTSPPTQLQLPVPSLQDNDNAQFAIEEDSQAALSGECESESQTYTIRSDLFLHGNILHNDDSEQIAGAEGSSLLVVPHTAEPDLDMLEHPTIDLMQEELMYTDPGVDESSFRVFLLSGEELV